VNLIGKRTRQEESLDLAIVSGTLANPNLSDYVAALPAAPIAN
jgi:hypothetical protein